jgi:hypothetical protein
MAKSEVEDAWMDPEKEAKFRPSSGEESGDDELDEDHVGLAEDDMEIGGEVVSRATKASKHSQLNSAVGVQSMPHCYLLASLRMTQSSQDRP